MADTTRPKVFQIGFNKCGTRALGHLFRQHGYRVAHWEEGTLALALARDIDRGRPPLKDWDLDVFLDIEVVNADYFFEGRKFYKILHETYPDAVFVMNHRDFDDWVASRTRHDNGKYEAWFLHHLGLDSRDALEVYWAHDWGTHMSDTHAYFEAHPTAKFVSFHIDRPDFNALGQACGHPIDPRHWTKIGASDP